MPQNAFVHHVETIQEQKNTLIHTSHIIAFILRMKQLRAAIFPSLLPQFIRVDSLILVYYFSFLPREATEIETVFHVCDNKRLEDSFSWKLIETNNSPEMRNAAK